MVLLHFQCLLKAGPAPIDGYFSLTTLVAAYEDYSRKQPAPVIDGQFFHVQWVSPYDGFHCTHKWKSSCP